MTNNEDFVVHNHDDVNYVREIQRLEQLVDGLQKGTMITVTDAVINSQKVKFVTPNEMTSWRVKTLYTKEPVTIQWLSQLSSTSVLYDVGANMGIYSVYAAMHGARVFAFEPESQNYALLVRNGQINKLSNLIDSYCLAISDQQRLTHLQLSGLEIGSSGHNEIHTPVTNNKLKQGCVSASIDELVSAGLPHPTHIKVDVDGNEPFVINGALNTLKNVQSLIIEIDSNREDHRTLVKNLVSMGFVYDSEQVTSALRKQGRHKGLGEYVFNRK